MRIVRYSPDRQEEWDNFIESSRNGTFLFMRGYMDYHSDRFKDHSLMYYSDKGKLLSVMAANEVVTADGGRTLHSHQGLTYGGFVLAPKSRLSDVGELFDITINYLRESGFLDWYYKQMPIIYHQLPSEEDEYWLWRSNASLIRCDISCSVPIGGQAAIQMERRRKRGIKKSISYGYHIIEDNTPDIFWPIMTDNLRVKYGVSPVHSLYEMNLLKKRFHDRIKIFLCNDKNDKTLAGCIIYIANSKVIHVQYAHATSEGKKNGAIDLLYSFLIEKYSNNEYLFFDIGTSNEGNGKILNNNLVAQKEGFGGRGVVYKQYRIKL